MASAWGGSWGRSWGNAWGSIIVGLCAYDNGNPYDNAYEYDASACPWVAAEALPEIGRNAPPLASQRYPQGRRRNLRLENEKVRARTVRRQEEDLLLAC